MDTLYTGLLAPAIVAAIAAIGSIVVAIIQNRKTNKKIDEVELSSDLNAIRQQILLLILEDKDNVRDGKLPTNKQAIEMLFDKYKSRGGNSYIADKVQSHLEYLDELTVAKEG